MASRIFAITFFAIVVLLLCQIGVIFAPFLISVLWAILLGRFAFPQHARRWFGGRPSPFPLVMVALTVLCSLLPFDGTALICGPLTLYLFWAAAPWKAIMLAVWGTVVVVGMVDNVLKRMLIGRGTHVPTLFLFFSIVGGLAAYGFIGMFAGPVVLAVLLTALVFMKKILEQDGKRPRKRPCNAEELGRPLGERDRSVIKVSNCEQTAICFLAMMA